MATRSATTRRPGRARIAIDVDLGIGSFLNAAARRFIGSDSRKGDVAKASKRLLRERVRGK